MKIGAFSCSEKISVDIINDSDDCCILLCLAVILIAKYLLFEYYKNIYQYNCDYCDNQYYRCDALAALCRFCAVLLIIHRHVVLRHIVLGISILLHNRLTEIRVRLLLRRYHRLRLLILLCGLCKIILLLNACRKVVRLVHLPEIILHLRCLLRSDGRLRYRCGCRLCYRHRLRLGCRCRLTGHEYAVHSGHISLVWLFLSKTQHLICDNRNVHRVHSGIFQHLLLSCQFFGCCGILRYAHRCTAYIADLCVFKQSVPADGAYLLIDLYRQLSAAGVTELLTFLIRKITFGTIRHKLFRRQWRRNTLLSVLYFIYKHIFFSLSHLYTLI